MLRVGPVSLPPGATAAAAVCLAFVVTVFVRHAASGISDLAAVVLAIALGGLIARLVSGTRLRVVGVLTVAVVAWLLPQRNDNASAAILGAFLGAGIGLTVGTRAADGARGRPRTTGALVLLALAGFTAYVGAETPGSHWFGGGITRGLTSYDEVALTFDDGPNLTATLPIMRILDAAHVKGTFFEVGKAIDADPQITRALYAHEQLLGNHSYNHDQLRWLDPRYLELERTQKAFQRAIGVCPAYYRPPHGERTPFLAHVVNTHHMRIIMWDVSSGDWALTNPRTIARRIVRGAKPGAIIVLHDGLDGIPTRNRDVLVRALPLILDGLRAKHLHAVGLDRLIGGPAYVRC